MIKFYCDGSTKNNGQKDACGGFGVVAIKDNKILHSYSEDSKNTTNNREELKALIHSFEIAQKYFPNEKCIIYSDSAYVVNMCNNWIHSWARNNWKNSKKKIVENIDLVKSIYNYLNIDFFNCQIDKVTGHNGIVGNELADALASGNMNKFNRIISENQIEI